MGNYKQSSRLHYLFREITLKQHKNQMRKRAVNGMCTRNRTICACICKDELSREPVTVIGTLTQKSGLNNHYMPLETFPKYMVHKQCVLNRNLMRVNSVSTQSRTEESEFEHIPKAIYILQRFSTLPNQPVGSTWNPERLDLMSNLS